MKHKCICEQLVEMKPQFDGYHNTEVDIDEFDSRYVALKLEYNTQTNDFYIVAYGDSEAQCTIKYCPFCGKKLSDVVKKHNKVIANIPKFVSNCYINKITPELIEKLKRLGYKHSPQYDSTCDCLHVRTGIVNRVRLNDPHFVEEHYDGMNKDSEYNGVDCGTNEELFLAVAGLREDTDFDQWFVCGDDWEKVADELPSKYMQMNGHKATLEEIIDNFK